MDNPEALRRLWAPWRDAFIRGKKPRGCVFCRAKRSRAADRRNLVIARGPHAFAILNLYPYNNGHLMIAPYRHIGRIDALTAEEWLDIRRLLQALSRKLRQRLHPHGMNVGVNLGRAAGAGVLGHLHVHLVPRWIGDENFMPVLGRTKVLSQSLRQLHALLTNA
ncbi:MAG: HIT domain-containing protein [Candidatus Omnitrophica bacterium]|nr:HIT domain-containing protein [Candidatus Omnitrophota bacterium]